MKSNYLVLSLILSSLVAISCSKKSDDATANTTASEDSSVSGAAASSVGSAISSSSSSGTVTSVDPRQGRPSWVELFLAPTPLTASTACPTVRTANGSGCANSGSNAKLTYSACSFGTSAATWSGILQVSLGSGTVACGTFPSPISTTLNRQFVDASGNPSSGTRTSASGTVVTIDHATANLGNYQSDTIAATIGTGYGHQVTFNSSGARTGVVVNEHLSTSSWNHSVTGSLNISEASGSRTVSGTVTIYHNIAKVKGTATFTSVVYNDTCCFPVSGTITTAFASTSASGALGTAMNGKTETMTLTGCGTGTFVDYSGSSSSVTLSHCM